jgi:hypothetical protein
LISDLTNCDDGPERMEIYSALASLGQDFIGVSLMYGKLIISEGITFYILLYYNCLIYSLFTC